MRLMLRTQTRPQGDKLRFYPPPPKDFCNYVHHIISLCFTLQIVVVGSCSCRVEILVFFAVQNQNRTFHCSTSTQDFDSKPSLPFCNLRTNNKKLFKYYQISTLAVNSEIAPTASSTLPPGECPHESYKLAPFYLERFCDG